MKHLFLGLTIAGSLLATALPTEASIVYYTTDLSGLNESTPTGSTGTGIVYVTIDDAAHTMRVEVSFSGLLSPTTNSHIHCCIDAPGNVGVATPLAAFFPLGVLAGSMDVTLDTTLAASFASGFIGSSGGTAAGAEAALFAGLSAGRAYFNIHTRAFPGSEIRGFLTQVPDRVPEPSTIALLGFGLAGIVCGRRRAA